MKKIQKFTPLHLQELDDAVFIAEELVNDYYKISSSHWLKNRYDIKTYKDLAPSERVEGPFAQVVGYVARKKDASLGSLSFNYYIICLQDNTILASLEKNRDLLFFPFLIYVLVHELVHIVRFSKFQQIYAASCEAEIVVQEEKKVHDLTWEILSSVSVSGMKMVLEHYRKWRENLNFDKVF
ncbi:MAG: hypothetical protein U9N77_14200 [Thermodesulfobacteriota bacterium]|nr:hypothetical protein [Thermodesulfobacteriota bacterium]